MAPPRIPKPGDPDYDPDAPIKPITGDTRAGNPRVPIVQDPNAPDGGGTDTGQNPDNTYPPQSPVVQHPELRNPPTTTKEGDPKTYTEGPAQYFPPTPTLAPYDPTPTGANVHDTGPADPNVDPFAAIGGGVYINGGWQPKDMATAQAYLAAHPGGAAGAASGAAPGGTPVGTPGGGSEMDAAMREAILNLLHSKMPTNNELAQTPEAAAYRLASQRGHERDVAQLATDASVANFTGTPEQEAKRRGLGEQRGEREAAFMGQLATQRLQIQRDDIQKGIVAAQSQGQFEAAQALQLQLAQMDDAIRRLQLEQNKTLTEEGYDVQRDLAEAQNNLQRYNIDTSRLTAKEQIDLNRELGLSELGFKYNQSALDDRYRNNELATR